MAGGWVRDAIRPLLASHYARTGLQLHLQMTSKSRESIPQISASGAITAKSLTGKTVVAVTKSRRFQQHILIKIVSEVFSDLKQDLSKLQTSDKKFSPRKYNETAHKCFQAILYAFDHWEEPDDHPKDLCDDQLTLSIDIIKDFHALLCAGHMYWNRRNDMRRLNIQMDRLFPDQNAAADPAALEGLIHSLKKTPWAGMTGPLEEWLSDVVTVPSATDTTPELKSKRISVTRYTVPRESKSDEETKGNPSTTTKDRESCADTAQSVAPLSKDLPEKSYCASTVGEITTLLAEISTRNVAPTIDSKRRHSQELDHVEHPAKAQMLDQNGEPELLRKRRKAVTQADSEFAQLDREPSFDTKPALYSLKAETDNTELKSKHSVSGFTSLDDSGTINPALLEVGQWMPVEIPRVPIPPPADISTEQTEPENSSLDDQTQADSQSQPVAFSFDELTAKNSWMEEYIAEDACKE